MKIFARRHPVIRDINRYFSFLFDRGYKIRYQNFKQKRMVFWSVFLESKECFIHIFQDHDQVFVSYAPLSYAIENNEEFFLQNEYALQIMIFYVTNGKTFIGNFEKEIYRNRTAQFQVLASLLNEYHNRIVPCFSSLEFPIKLVDIEKASKYVNGIQIDKYVLGKHTGY